MEENAFKKSLWGEQYIIMQIYPLSYYLLL